jgi:thimet oligopeptidase
LFGIQFKKWNTPVWDPLVEPYEVYQDGKLIGRIYIDSHPRPGKYTHADTVPFRAGIAGDSVPEGALVMNLPNGNMEHADVETFLHEFGHLLHHTFAGTHRWFGESGITTEWDFVEAPSQMLENWVYDYDTLAKFARNKDGQVIPRALVEKMNEARYFGLGMSDMRQLGLSNISLKMHTEPTPEYVGEATRYYLDKYATIPTPDYVQMQDAFGHLNGYSAMYYTYRWSIVIADDMFTRFQKEGLRNPETAAEYRKDVLSPGGTRPAAQLVHDFLGRDISLDAYRAKMAKDR